MEKTMDRRVGLSNDIIDVIWTKLPLCNLPNCRQVCKQWNNLALTISKFDHPNNNASISNNNLFFAHVSHSSSNLHCLDFVPNDSKGDVNIVASFTFHLSWPSTYVKIVNSCNGLVCFSFRNMLNEICVLNPMINEYVYTDFVAKKRMRESNYGYGFGFSLMTKHYKVVRYSPTYPDSTVVEIIEFGTSSIIIEWRYVCVVPFSLDKVATYFNGALYWLGTLSKPPSLFHQQSKYVFRFDLEDETFEKISFPQLPTDEGGEPLFCFLGVFHGRLYLTFRQDSSSEHQVWKMDSSCSWIRAFVIPMPNGAMRLQLIKVCEDGQILCLAPGFNLILYNPTTDEVQILKLKAEFKQLYMVHPIDSFHFDSLHNI